MPLAGCSMSSQRKVITHSNPGLYLVALNTDRLQFMHDVAGRSGLADASLAAVFLPFCRHKTATVAEAAWTRRTSSPFRCVGAAADGATIGWCPCAARLTDGLVVIRDVGLPVFEWKQSTCKPLNRADGRARWISLLRTSVGSGFPCE